MDLDCGAVRLCRDLAHLAQRTCLQAAVFFVPIGNLRTTPGPVALLLCFTFCWHGSLKTIHAGRALPQNGRVCVCVSGF